MALLLFLYLTKGLILIRFGDRLAVAIFSIIIAVCIPVTWAFDENPDFTNMDPLVITVGYPVGILTVPCVSFLIDIMERSRNRRGSHRWRWPVELFFVVPAWLYIWVYFEFLVLGWIWI